MITCYVDGGVPPKPKSCYARFLIIQNGKVAKYMKITFVEHGTNNQMEYRALISLLKYLVKAPPQDRILIKMDSRLVIKQVTNKFAVNNAKLKQLKQITSDLLAQIPDYKFQHISGRTMKVILGC